MFRFSRIERFVEMCTVLQEKRLKDSQRSRHLFLLLFSKSIVIKGVK